MRRNCNDISMLKDQFQELEGKLKAHVATASAEEQRFQDHLTLLESTAKLTEERVEDRLSALDTKIEKSSQWGQKVVGDSLDNLQQQLAALKAQLHDTDVAKSCARQPAQNFQEELEEWRLAMESKLLFELQASTESVEIQMQLMDEKLLHAVHQIGALEAVVNDQCCSFSKHYKQTAVDAVSQTSQSPNLVDSQWLGSDVAGMPSVQAHPRIARMSRQPTRYSCMGL